VKIVEVKVSELIFAEYNPRQLTEQQGQDLKDSVQRFGFVDPIIVNSNKDRMNIIIGGHQRCRMAQILDIEKIPVHYINLNPDKEKELNIRLNKNTGEWDFDQLANHFDTDQLIEWGFDDSDFNLNFSDANKEIDVEDFEDNIELKFKLSQDEYAHVTSQLSTIDENKELALLKILEYAK